jgi:acyl carrier protein
MLDLGLDSLCFVMILSRLETLLGLDPFSDNEAAPFPVILGEFIHFYENAVQ